MKIVNTSGLWHSHLLGQITGTSTNRNYDEAAKYVRNRLRPYDAISIVRIALEKLNASNHQSMDHLQTWPWLTCLIVKLMLEDEKISFKGKECPEFVFNRCLNALWDAQAGRDRFTSKQNVWLQVRAMLTAQLSFQRSVRWDFLRLPALIDRLEANHPSRIHFVDRFKMDPHVFMCITYTILAGVLSGKKILATEYYSQLTEHFGDAVGLVFDEFSRDLAGLRKQLILERSERQIKNQPIRPTHEYHEEPWLQRFPLLRTERDKFLVWHPIVFSRGLEIAVHRGMSDRAAEYSNSFSKVFEAYVMELLADSRVPFTSECQYKQLVGRDKKSVEAIICQDGAVIFIEAKMTTYSEVVNISGEAGRVWTGMKRIYEAMRQGWAVASMLKSDKLDAGPWKQTNENYLLIVTSQRMECASGEQFQRWFGRDVFDTERLHNAKQKIPSLEQLRMLPPEHIVIASIDEYEYLMQALKDGNLHLLTMFREIASQIVSPSTSFMHLSQFLEKNYPCDKGSPVVMEVIPKLNHTFAKCFGVDPSAFDLTP